MTTHALLIPSNIHQCQGDATPFSPRSCLPLPRSALPEVIIGVDTHKDIHVAAALTLTGQVVGTQSFPTTRIGFTSLLSWAQRGCE